MTTPGNGGADSTPSTPAEDDVFGYLYADGQAAGATPPPGGGGYGYPGRSSSFQQVRTVGERQYGQQQAAGQPAYGRQPMPASQQSSAYYAAPETLPGGPGGPAAAQAPSRRGGGGGGGGRGPNTKGLLIGALAVVAAVVIGIGIVVFTTPDDKTDNVGSEPPVTEPKGDSGGGPADKGADDKADKAVRTEKKLPKEDAKALTLAGGTTVASDVKGAKAAGGTYVAGLNAVGASATWAFQDIPKAGKYTLYVGYGVPGKAASTTLSVNGKPQSRKLNMGNFAKAPEGAWDKGWTNTYANVLLDKGTNTLMISCEQGDKCGANLDQVWLVKGWED